MKKLTTLFVMIAVLMTSTISYAAAPLQIIYNKQKINYSDKQIKSTYNGKRINIDKTPGILIDTYAMLPYEEVFKKSGIKATTTYDKKTKVITITKDKITIKMTVGSKTAYVNKVKKTMGVAPVSVQYVKSKQTRILVSSRFVAENLGLSYNWNSKTSTVEIGQKGMAIEYGGKKYIYTNKPADIFVNDDIIDSSMQGLIINKTLMVPARDTFSLSALALDYTYSKTANTVVITGDENTIQMTLGQKTAYINDKKVTMPQAPLLVKMTATNIDYVMVPAQYMADILGYTYDYKNGVVSISTPQEDIDTPDIEEPNEQDTEDEPDDLEDENQNPEDDGNIGEDETNKEPSSISITRPSSVKKGTFSTYDDYLNRQFIITIPGDYVDYYNEFPIDTNGKAVVSIKPSLNSQGNTDLIIKTLMVKGFVITEDSSSIKILMKAPKDMYKKIVVMDAGHGGSDPGALGFSMQEKVLTKKITDYSKEYFDQDKSIKVYYTRNQDYEPSITSGSGRTTGQSVVARYTFANEVEADILISVHMNSFTTAAPRGTEVYYSSTQKLKTKTGLTSPKLANMIYPKLTEAVGSLKRGVKDQRLGMCYGANMPSILIETAYISNAQDAEILKNEDKLNGIAKCIYDGIVEAFRQYPTGR